MKKEGIISICAVAFLAMLVIALFNNDHARHATEEVLHEITTADMFKQSAYAPAVNDPTFQWAGQGGAPAQGQGYNFNQSPTMQQAAMAGAPALFPGQQAPVLIKQMGAEVIPVGGGKVKITGVMGNSWADKAGLKAGDILLTFNTKTITGLEQFQDLVAKVLPEKDYKITFLRGSRKKKGVLTIGEGEMEGFTPIEKPK